MKFFSPLVAAILCLPTLLLAQAYPNKTVKIIVPFAASGPADNYARFMAQRLQDELKQTFVIENKPGAGSIIGTDFAAKSPADGYTLLMMSNTQTVNESLVQNKPFQLMRDFVAVAPVNYSDLILVVNPKFPAKTLPELITLVKASPGKYNYASSGNGTPYHMAGELFKSMAGLDITHIPYKGSSGARTDVLGGQVDMMFDAITTMNDFAKENKVVALATSGRNRSVITPNLPTLNEAGVPKYETSIWLGFMAPKGTPNEVVTTLNNAIRKIIAQQDVKDTWAKQGAIPLVMTPNEFTKYLEADIAKWAAIVKSAGIKPD
jgi:tripartite-type tricarboxylate transporter receptor subunit TctC